MVSRHTSRSRSRNGRIDTLDFDAHRRPSSSNSDSRPSTVRGLLADDESFLSNVVEGIIERDRRKMERQVTKYLSFASAIMSSLCAGSLTAYSVYGHLFLSRLHYTQFQVNIVSIAAELAMYLPVPIFGYLCDRYSPQPLALFAGILFGFGYFLAAYTYRAGPVAENGWPFGVMVLAFVAIGMATSSMYLSAVTACVKNFGRGKHKGLALSLPIAAFGLSGMWQSQVGSKLLYETNDDGVRGDVNVFHFFLFLGGTLLAMGLIGSLVLKIVDEEEIIDEGVDELERSGFFEDSPFFRRNIHHDHEYNTNSYGTLTPRRLSNSSSHNPLIQSISSLKDREIEEARKKTWLLNAESHRFLADPTMWFLAGGFFLVTGPVETFINNLGTIIDTLYSPPAVAPPSNSAATHVSVLAISSTLARLLVGALSDILSPSPPSHQPQTSSASSSISNRERFTVSRLTLLLIPTFLLALSFFTLASPLIANTPSLFPFITAFVGIANGASFALVPILISVVWGVQNFGTNWGIVAMMPAIGATIWSGIYSVVYQNGVRDGELCYGRGCFEMTVVGMGAAALLAVVLWGWAWRGRGGWVERGVAV